MDETLKHMLQCVFDIGSFFSPNELNL